MISYDEKVENIKWKKQFFESLNDGNLKTTSLEAIKVISKYAFEGYPSKWALNAMEELRELCDSPITIESLRMDMDELKKLKEA